MKTIILCGGLGTRLAEETVLRPKPMVTVGGHPILWHILNTYGHYGHNDFRVDLSSGKVEHIRPSRRNWRVELVDTGSESMTGGRLHRLEPLLRPTGTFMLTYGDGVSDVDINRLVAFHRSHGKIATVTAVRPPARFGGMVFDGDKVVEFLEKPQTGEGWINGGYFVFEPQVFDYLNGDSTVLEGSSLESLARDGQLMAYKHEGFWQCMDTVRDRQLLESLWSSGQAPWKR